MNRQAWTPKRPKDPTPVEAKRGFPEIAKVSKKHEKTHFSENRQKRQKKAKFALLWHIPRLFRFYEENPKNSSKKDPFFRHQKPGNSPFPTFPKTRKPENRKNRENRENQNSRKPENAKTAKTRKLRAQKCARAQKSAQKLEKSALFPHTRKKKGPRKRRGK